MSWLCDAMLGRLARLLRAAGEDVAMVDADADDPTVVARARREGRRLLTRARRLAETAGAGALWIAAQAPMEQAEALARLAPVD
ncbi:MAG: Mut7-C RNAse domain-containing protein, partial [Alphaproteobacteria bacterium]